jgi:phosphatidylserine/phosphatidylglycerophosphate/cardiolipin synthase-like enzyme
LIYVNLGERTRPMSAPGPEPKMLKVAWVKIHLYQRSFLHAKFRTIDDHIDLVGTSNMDICSFVLNAEHILVIHDPGMTSRLKTEQQHDITNCRSLDLQQWRQRPFRIKLGEHLTRLMSRSCDSREPTGKRFSRPPTKL